VDESTLKTTQQAVYRRPQRAIADDPASHNGPHGTKRSGSFSRMVLIGPKSTGFDRNLSVKFRYCLVDKADISKYRVHVVALAAHASIRIIIG